MCHLQLYDDGPGFDFVHLQESEALGAGEPFFRLVVLELEEDGCTCGVRADRVSTDGAGRRERTKSSLPDGDVAVALAPASWHRDGEAALRVTRF